MAFTNPFRFSTKYQDDETGLLYYGYRYYNSSTGRWLSRDPIGEQGSLNLYLFVNNAPLTYFDPYGLCSKKNCHALSEKIEIKEYKVVGLTLTLEARGQVCSCCCAGKAVDVGISYSWQVGFGLADEFTFLGYKVGYDILGPQVGGATELHYVKECGEPGGALHADQTANGILKGQLGGGFGIVGVSGSYGGNYFIEGGIEADETGADGYLVDGYDVTANGTISVGAGILTANYTFTHVFSSGGGVKHTTPRIKW
jgi:RHS repeat-associated protein